MICVRHIMRHGVDSSHVQSHKACKFGLSVSAYSQIREIRVPGGVLPGGGRPGLKYGISRKILEIWQPYVTHRSPQSRDLSSLCYFPAYNIVIVRKSF